MDSDWISIGFVYLYQKPIQDIYIFLLFVASAFLLMTVIVYTIIWDRHTLHGWTVFSEVLSNFLMIVTVGLAHYFVRNVDNGPPSYGCVALGEFPACDKIFRG